MIIRKSGAWFAVIGDRLVGILGMEWDDGTKYFCDPFLEHYLLQGDEGVVVNGEISAVEGWG